jgi:hypothetical protein
MYCYDIELKVTDENLLTRKASARCLYQQVRQMKSTNSSNQSGHTLTDLLIFSRHDQKWTFSSLMYGTSIGHQTTQTTQLMHRFQNHLVLLTNSKQDLFDEQTVSLTLVS